MAEKVAAVRARAAEAMARVVVVQAKVAAMQARAAARVRAGAARATVAEARVARVAARVVPNNTVSYLRRYGQSASISDGLPHLQLQWFRGSCVRCRPG